MANWFQPVPFKPCQRVRLTRKWGSYSKGDQAIISQVVDGYSPYDLTFLDGGRCAWFEQHDLESVPDNEWKGP